MISSLKTGDLIQVVVRDEDGKPLRGQWGVPIYSRSAMDNILDLEYTEVPHCTLGICLERHGPMYRVLFSTGDAGWLTAQWLVKVSSA